MVHGNAGKGDKPRPRQISREEYDLRDAYMKGKLHISEKEMKKRITKIRDKHASTKRS